MSRTIAHPDRDLPGRAGYPAHSLPPTPMRLTRRGRRVVATLASALVLVTLNSVNALQASAQDTAPTVQVMTVAPGQTLWEIALSVAPERDPRETVWRIQQLNGLAESSLVDGQKLLVPVTS